MVVEVPTVGAYRGGSAERRARNLAQGSAVDDQADEVDQAAVTSGRALLLGAHSVAASIWLRFARAAGIPTVLDIDNVIRSGSFCR
jgi:hypothetical protein